MIRIRMCILCAFGLFVLHFCGGQSKSVIFGTNKTETNCLNIQCRGEHCEPEQKNYEYKCKQ